LQEIKELQAEQCPDFIADALEVRCGPGPSLSTHMACMNSSNSSCNSSFLHAFLGTRPVTAHVLTVQSSFLLSGGHI
jgi:hypothetical protein